MKLLMHICCAPCANMPIDALRADGIDLTGYWYNPNIHPFTEYRARRNCLQEYAKTIELPLLVRDDYGLRPFVREVADDIAGRCVKCYEMRLFEAARAAKEGGFDAFTSSLFISPYQKHELMRDVAYLAAEENGVTFYYQDFRPMFRDGQAKMPWEYHCGHVYKTYRENVLAIYPEEGQKVVDKVDEDFIQAFGEEAMNTVRSYLSTDFNTIG